MIDYVPLPESRPRPREHTRHDLVVISSCVNCGAPWLLGCRFRTKSDHPKRTIRTFCVHTEKVAHDCGRLA